MPRPLYDAHCHLTNLAGRTITSVVNGTSPDDWQAVLKYAGSNPNILPAIGLHPWKVKEAPSNWRATFLSLLEQGAQAVGEIGLDQWIEAPDIQEQEAAFHWQLTQAAERNLPVSIHCLKASDALLRQLKKGPFPARGVHLHAYSGSAEQVSQFTALGPTYFSFHAKQLRGPARKAPAALKAVPADRLLIETDAPDTLDARAEYAPFLESAYEAAAALRGETLETLIQQVQTNFQTYFLDD